MNRLLASVFGWFGFAGSALRVQPGKQSGVPNAVLVEGSANIGPDLALQISTVWACVSRRASTVASLPFFAYTNENGRRALDRGSLLWALLHESPNRRMTPYEFWQTMMLNHDLRGNAYARLDRDKRTGEVMSMWPMPADQVQAVVQADGSMVYLYRVGEDVAALAEENVLHLKDMGNGTVGLPRLEYMRGTTTEGQNAQWQANRVFGSSGKPTGVLMLDHVLKKEQREALQARFSEMASGSTARLFLLEANMKYQQLSLSPEAQQLLESRRFAVEEICRWFDVPPVLVHHSNVTTWGSGIEQIVDGFHKFTVRPLLVSIEQAVRKRVMTPAQRARMTVEFSLDALLRASLKDRMEIYAKGVQNGINNRNECRQLENLEPYEGGEIFTAQSNLAPIDKLGEVPETAAPEAAEPQLQRALITEAEFRRERHDQFEARQAIRHNELLQFIAASRTPVTSAPIHNINLGDNTMEFHEAEKKAPVVNVQNEVHPSPALLTVQNNVSPTPVNVNASFEATMPAPEVTVNLPARKTETTVMRDGQGNIVRASQLETDV